MKSSSLSEVKQTLDNPQYKSPTDYISNKDSYNCNYNYNYFETNIISNNSNSFLIQKISMEKIFKIIKKRTNQNNKIVFDKLKKFLCDNNKKNMKNNFVLYDLKKEIFLDKIKTNKLKEEYYNKCNTMNKKGINSNFRNKLFKGILYKSKTHNFLLDKNIFTNRKNNINSHAININIENKENDINNINRNINGNNLVIKNSNIFHLFNNKKEHHSNNNNPIAKSTIIEKRKTIFNISSIYTKRINLLKNNNNNNGVEENNNYFSSTYKESREYKEEYIDICKKNKTLNKFYNKTNHTNNIFLSDDLDDYQAETYNQNINNNNNFNSYSSKINSDRNIYKKNSFSYTQRINNFTKNNQNNYNALNEYNDKQFKEIIINYNNKGQISFAGLRKNLKEEFNNSKKSKSIKYMKNKVHSNNKFITYNNIININDAQIIHKAVNLKNCENNPKIQTYLISFKSFNKNNSTVKNACKNFFREDIIYHRPKSSSKFRNTNKTNINLDNIYN